MGRPGETLLISKKVFSYLSPAYILVTKVIHISSCIYLVAGILITALLWLKLATDGTVLRPRYGRSC